MNIKIQNGSPLTIGISGSQQTPWGQISGIFTACSFLPSHRTRDKFAYKSLQFRFKESIANPAGIPTNVPMVKAESFENLFLAYIPLES